MAPGQASVYVAPVQADADEQLEQAIDDIKEWLVDNGAGSFVDRLAPPASEDEIAELEAELGVALPAGLRQLYRTHDGQRGEVEPLFEHMLFVSLREAAQLRASVLLAYIEPPAGVALRDYHAEHAQVSDAELESRNWLPFANSDGDYLAVQLDSGRVYRLSKGEVPWIRLAAEDVATFIGDYASAMWGDAYQFHGDPSQPGVVEDGLRYLSRYLARG